MCIVAYLLCGYTTDVQIRKQMQANTNADTHAGDSVVQVRTVYWLLTSVLRHEGRDTILKSLSYHTMLTTSTTFGTSRGVLDLNSSLPVEIRKIQPYTSTVETPTQWQRTSFSAPMAEAQLSVCMVQSQILNWRVFKILNCMIRLQLLNIMVGTQMNLFSKFSRFSAHLFWAWRHRHSSPISRRGVHYDNGDCHILCARA